MLLPRAAGIYGSNNKCYMLNCNNNDANHIVHGGGYVTYCTECVMKKNFMPEHYYKDGIIYKYKKSNFVKINIKNNNSCKYKILNKK